jgi:hypothetical protein
MKLALLTIGTAVALAFAVSTPACNIEHKSGGYACEKNIDCESGRICNDGFCIVAGSIDAAPRTDGPRGDAMGSGSGSCPTGCTTCNVTAKTCTINCMAGANCTSSVTCPAGYSCNILCNTDNSCRNGINCQLGKACNIECTGKQSCQNVQCGAGPCDVACMGVASCKGVSCANSCACDVTCTGNQSCGDAVSCTSPACDTGSGCTSTPLFCHSCL